MKKRTSQLLAELKSLATVAKSNIYQRVSIAAEVLSDLDWIAATHGGSDLKAMDTIENEFFSDIRGLITIGELLAIRKQFPQELQWSEYKHDLAAMRILYREATQRDRDRDQPSQRPKWKDEAEQAKEKLEAVTDRLATIEEVASLQKSELQTLRDENARLRDENARLRGRIEELTSRRMAPA